MIRCHMVSPVSLPFFPNIECQIKAFLKFSTKLPLHFSFPFNCTVPTVGEREGKGRKGRNGTKERVTTARGRSWRSFAKI